MIGRAAFWLGVIALLTPHEPDIGLEHPSVVAFNLPLAADSGEERRGSGPLELALPALIKSFKNDFRGRKPVLIKEIRESLRQREQEQR